MTIQATKAAIKALSPNITVRYHSEHREWRVSMNLDWLRQRFGIDYPAAQNMNESIAAYTPYAEDAVSAAKDFVARYAL